MMTRLTAGMMSSPHGILPAIFLLIVCTLSFTTCVDVDAELRFAEDGSATVRLEYSISYLVEHVNLTGTDGNPAVLPLDADEFRSMVDRVSGVRIQSLSSESSDNTFTLACVMEIADTGTVEQLYRALCRRDLSIRKTEDRTVMTMELNSPDQVSGLTEVIPGGLELYLRQFEIRLRAESFTEIRSSVPGRIADGKAEITIPALDLARRDGGVSWRVEW